MFWRGGAKEMNVPACLEYWRSGTEEGVLAVHGVIGKD